MRLGIDLDGVAADFDGGWIAAYQAEFGTPPRSRETWDGLHHATHFTDMRAFWDWIHDRHVFRHLKPVPGAVEALTRLAADGHDIVILTAKPDRAVHDTLHWIADQKIPTREIHFLHAKHRIACDVYLDDSPVVLPSLVTHRPRAVVCRMVAPWNQPVSGALDVVDWSDFLSLVGRVVGRQVV
jgi:5'(3')-deoxyribonucleotidase